MVSAARFGSHHGRALRRRKNVSKWPNAIPRWQAAQRAISLGAARHSIEYEHRHEPRAVFSAERASLPPAAREEPMSSAHRG